MFRRYLSLVVPTMCIGAAALAYQHFRAAPPALAADGKVAQVAQAEEDPFGTPADPPAVPPAVPPVDPLAPPAVKHLDPAAPADPAAPRKKRVRREVPRSDDEVKSPFLRSLLGQLDSFSDVSDEERDGVRKMLYDADVELHGSTGPNARRRIEFYNNTNRRVLWSSPGPRTANGPVKKREDYLRSRDPRDPRRVRPIDPTVPAPVDPVPPVRPVPPKKKPDPFKEGDNPLDPSKPKDEFDDLFKKE
jgi:hypothetical protein